MPTDRTTSKSLFVAPATLALLVALSAPVSADLVFTAAAMDSAGPIGDTDNTTISAVNTSSISIYSNFIFAGNLTEVDTATFGNEARFNLRSGAYDATFQPSTTGPFTGTLNVAETRTGAFWGPDPGAYDVESFESFDDGTGVDATWANVNFKLSGALSILDLGTFADGSSFLFDTEGSLFDTELGGLTGSGLFLASNDDSGTGLLSLLDLGTLGIGDYYLALGGFNTIFADHVVYGGAGNGAYNVNLNGSSVATGNLAAGEVSLLSFSVIDPATGVPAPASILLLGLGLALFARRRR